MDGGGQPRTADAATPPVGSTDPVASTDPGRLGEVLGRWAARGRRGVVFDFNGTLSDDEPVLLAVFSELFDVYLGRPLSAEDYYAHLVGRSDREIITAVLGEQADQVTVERLLARRGERYRALVAARPPIDAAAMALLRVLSARRIPVAVVTGAQRADVEFVLDRCAVADCVDVLVAEEDVERGKPDPEGFLLGAARLAVAPGDLVAFEDSAAGVRAAKAAGLPCIAVRRRGGAPPPGADAVIDRLGPGLLEMVAHRTPEPAAG